ncbi:MAG: di-heme oxidoredictase family protein [Gammaproteobacteria bacterium]
MKQHFTSKRQPNWLVIALSAALMGGSSFTFASDPGADIDYSHLTPELIKETDGVAHDPFYHNLKGNGPALDADINDDDFSKMSLTEIRQIGVRMYTTPFRRADGFGDGPGINDAILADGTPALNIPDLGPTGRPTLQGNGTWLRMNGLDTQTCLECHGVVDNSVIPAQLGVGGQAGIAGSPFFRSKTADIDDSGKQSFGGGDNNGAGIGEALGIAAFDGRSINPPANFGMGGVELVGQEMTETLQKIAAYAESKGKCLPLRAKGIDFGTTCEPEGVDGDLEIRPFGRKGEFATIRGFDEGALAFHIGMQDETIFGAADADGDGISLEISNAQARAFHIFMTTQERPVQKKANREARRGFKVFNEVGCSGCHVPFIDTKSRHLEYTDPESEEVYFSADLSKGLTNFEKNRQGGIRVRAHSDYKRHNMGYRLKETAHFLGEPEGENACQDEVAGAEIDNCNFITMKLWGVADTAPYLHDGRALTLFEAVALHGGEAQEERDRFLSLSERSQNALFAYLGTLKHPENPNQDVENQVVLSPNSEGRRDIHRDRKKRSYNYYDADGDGRPDVN